MVIGTGAAFAGLATLPCPLYYLEHPTLYDGKIVQAMELPQHYAGAIQGECLLTRWTTVDLIGASFGGWLVCAAKHNHAIPVSPTSTDTVRAPHVHIQCSLVPLSLLQAHRIALGAGALRLATRTITLLDPPPPVVISPGSLDLEPPSLRQDAITFLSLQLATLARMTERDAALDRQLDSLRVASAAWPETDIIIRVAGLCRSCGIGQGCMGWEIGGIG